MSAFWNVLAGIVLIFVTQVCWFEDGDALEGLKKQQPAVSGVITEWSDHSNGMHQFLGELIPRLRCLLRPANHI
jgi:hypothetical protein